MSYELCAMPIFLTPYAVLTPELVVVVVAIAVTAVGQLAVGFICLFAS
jgi:hypothetical protein